MIHDALFVFIQLNLKLEKNVLTSLDADLHARVSAAFFDGGLAMTLTMMPFNQFRQRSQEFVKPDAECMQPRMWQVLTEGLQLQRRQQISSSKRPRSGSKEAGAAASAPGNAPSGSSSGSESDSPEDAKHKRRKHKHGKDKHASRHKHRSKDKKRKTRKDSPSKEAAAPVLLTSIGSCRFLSHAWLFLTCAENRMHMPLHLYHTFMLALNVAVTGREPEVGKSALRYSLHRDQAVYWCTLCQVHTTSWKRLGPVQVLFRSCCLFGWSVRLDLVS